MAVKYRTVSADMRVGRHIDRESTDSQPTWRPTCRPRVGRHVGRLSVDMSADTHVGRQRSLLQDDNFCTYTHKYFSILKVIIIIVQFYPWLQISCIVPARLVTYFYVQ